MAQPLRRYVLEVMLGNGYFTRNARGRKVFRYRPESVFLPFRSSPARARLNAERRYKRFDRETPGAAVVAVRWYSQRDGYI